MPTGGGPILAAGAEGPAFSPATIAPSLPRIKLQLLDRSAARLGSFLEGSFQQSRILYLPAAQQLLDSQNLDTRIRPRVERRLVFIEASFGGLFHHRLGRLLHRDPVSYTHLTLPTK